MDVRNRRFAAPYPASTLMIVSGFARPEFVVEIEVDRRRTGEQRHDAARSGGHEFSAPDFQSIDPMKTIALLPIAAVEQHGPHLPVGTDTILNLGCIDDADPARAGAISTSASCRCRRSGKSNEHLWQKGTVTHTARDADRGLDRDRPVGRARGHHEARDGQLARRQRGDHGHRRARAARARRHAGGEDGLDAVSAARRADHRRRAPARHPRRRSRDIADAALPARARRYEQGARTSARSPSDDEANYKYLRPTGTHAYAWIAQGPQPAWRRRRCLDRHGREGSRKSRRQKSAGCWSCWRELERHPLPKD